MSEKPRKTKAAWTDRADLSTYLARLAGQLRLGAAAAEGLGETHPTRPCDEAGAASELAALLERAACVLEALPGRICLACALLEVMEEVHVVGDRIDRKPRKRGTERRRP